MEPSAPQTPDQPTNPITPAGAPTSPIPGAIAVETPNVGAPEATAKPDVVAVEPAASAAVPSPVQEPTPAEQAKAADAKQKFEQMKSKPRDGADHDVKIAILGTVAIVVVLSVLALIAFSTQKS